MRTGLAIGGPPSGRRPVPAAPAKAWAIAIHSMAAGPSMTRARSLRCLRWVTSRQKSSAGPLIRLSASAGPHVHAVPSGPVSSTRISAAGTLLPCTA